MPPLSPADVAVLPALRARVHMPTETYTIWVGLVYVFNLMVGTGALALPAALAGAGWALGSVVLLVLALLSLLAATFVLEAQAAVCALRPPPYAPGSTDGEDEDEDEGQPLVCRPAPYTLDERVELGEMAQVLLGRRGRLVLYFTLCLYLYGDLSIYSAAIATSLKDVSCTFRPPGTDWANSTRLPDRERCWSEGSVTRGDCYRSALLLLTLALAPFAAGDLHNTKFLQLITSAMRWLALGTMIVLASGVLVRGEGEGAPPPARPAGLPALFGTSVYAFMWHHSVPGLVAPMRPKRRLLPLLALDYALVVAVYSLLTLTGAFAFGRLDPLYTLNFIPSDPGAASVPNRLLHYLLALFPVLTLSASYPVVAVTLRRNLLLLAGGGGGEEDTRVRRAGTLLATVLPPLLLTLLVEDVGVLISITGSIAGVGIQYVMPALLVWRARLAACGRYNPHASPARCRAGPLLLQAWAALCVVLVAVSLVQTNFVARTVHI